MPRSHNEGGDAGSNELTMGPDLPTVRCVLVSWKAILLYEIKSSTLPNSCQDQQQINPHVFRAPRPDMNIFKWSLLMQEQFDALAFAHYSTKEA